MGRAFANVHIRVRDLGRGVEGWHQPRADVFLQRRTADYMQAFVDERHQNTDFKISGVLKSLEDTKFSIYEQREGFSAGIN